MKISFEIEETVSVRTRRVVTGMCMHCAVQVEFVGVDGALRVLGLSNCQLSRLAEAGCIHYADPQGVFLCQNSIERCLEILKDRLLKGVASIPDAANYQNLNKEKL